MPRKPRLVAVDCPHHVTQRGNNQQLVFYSDADWRLYMNLLINRSTEHHLDILGYCLMPNHVHLIVIPRKPESMARALAAVHGVYAQHVNQETRRSGHLWQARYYSCPMDNRHLWAALRYVERNPVRAGIVSDPATWLWSSAAAHISGNPYADTRLRWEEWTTFFTGRSWRAFLGTQRVVEESVIRYATRSGRRIAADHLTTYPIYPSKR